MPQIPVRLATKFLIKTDDPSKPAKLINCLLIHKALEGNGVKYTSLKLFKDSLSVHVQDFHSAISLSKIKSIDKYQITVEVPAKFNTSQGIIFSEEALYTDGSCHYSGEIT